jgi:hypothetical protein
MSIVCFVLYLLLLIIWCDYCKKNKYDEGYYPTSRMMCVTFKKIFILSLLFMRSPPCFSFLLYNIFIKVKLINIINNWIQCSCRIWCLYLCLCFIAHINIRIRNMKQIENHVIYRYKLYIHLIIVKYKINKKTYIYSFVYM